MYFSVCYENDTVYIRRQISLNMALDITIAGGPAEALETEALVCQLRVTTSLRAGIQTVVITFVNV